MTITLQTSRQADENPSIIDRIGAMALSTRCLMSYLDLPSTLLLAATTATMWESREVNWPLAIAEVAPAAIGE